MNIFSWWWNHPAEEYQFWFPLSGRKGGFIAGCVLGAILGIILLIYA